MEGLVRTSMSPTSEVVADFRGNDGSMVSALKTLLFFTVLMVTVPIGLYFASKAYIFEGSLQMSNTDSYFYAAIVAVLAVHVVLALFVYVAWTEESGYVALPNSDSVACSPNITFAVNRKPWIALIKRGNCSHADKIRAAEQEGASAVVIYNIDGTGNSTNPMSHPGTGSTVAIMIGNHMGRQITSLVESGTEVYMSLLVGNLYKTWDNPLWVYVMSFTFFGITAIILGYFVFVVIKRLYRNRQLQIQQVGVEPTQESSMPPADVRFYPSSVSGSLTETPDVVRSLEQQAEARPGLGLQTAECAIQLSNHIYEEPYAVREGHIYENPTFEEEQQITEYQDSNQQTHQV
ncbi:hypothetical protein SRHO_G00123990 [Serrasalmus rhombeus]